MKLAKADPLREGGWAGESGEEDLGFGLVMGLSREDGVMAAGMGAADDRRTRRHFDAKAWLGGGDAAVVADLEDGALPPDAGPPRATRHGPPRGAVFLLGGVPGDLRFPLEFAVDFVRVAVQAQVANVGVSWGEIGKGCGSEVGREAVLPEEMFAFDLALGVRRGRGAETHAVAGQARAKARAFPSRVTTKCRTFAFSRPP